MPQFFIKSSDIVNNQYVIKKGEDFLHLRKVRRIRRGDRIDLRGDDGVFYKGIIDKVNPESIVVEIIERQAEINTEQVKLRLCAAILKGKTFDLVLQKATEIGVSGIVPVVTERTIPAIDNGDFKRVRWENIVVNASKQCMRKDIPVVEDTSSFKDVVINNASKIKLIAHTESNGKNIKDFLSGIFSSSSDKSDVAILIGPEGGFTPDEIEFAIRNGWNQVKFGFTSLRAETASIVLPAILIYEWSNTGEIKG